MSIMPVAGNTETTQPENHAFFPALDGLRAIAFMMVFLVHYYAFPWGWAGVNTFFVLSGFLITGILFDSRDAPQRARTFYIRRSLRIFPLYYGIFFLLLVLNPLMHWKWSVAWIAWPLYLGNFLRYLSPASALDGSSQQLAADAQLHTPRHPAQTIYMGHFWSLCVEEQFYLLWPWVVFGVRSRRALLWICSVVVILAPLLRLLLRHVAPTWMLQQGLLDRVTPLQLDSLLLGGLIALLWRGEHRDLLLKLGHIVAWIMLIVAVLYCACTFHIHEPNWRNHFRYPDWSLVWGLTFINVLSASLILAVLRPDGVLYRIFCLRPLRWAGRISYGAYVIHDMIHSLCETYIVRLINLIAPWIGGRSGLLLEKYRESIFPLVALAATLFLAWLSFRYFESWFLQLKNRLAPSRI